MRVICALIVLLGLCQNCNAEENLELTVQILESLTREPLTNSEVIITYDGQVQVFKTGKKDNAVVIELPLDYRYNIRCVSKGYVFKHVELDLRFIPEADKEGGFSLEMDVTLFPYREGFDFSVMGTPIGKAKYDSETDNIEFDLEHTITVKAAIAREQKKANARYEQDCLKWKAKGDKCAKKANYKKALKHYRKALNFTHKNSDLEQRYAELKQTYYGA